MLADRTNPSLFIVDSDVLLQLIATDQVRLLREIRADFGVQAVIVEAVHFEVAAQLQHSRKFMGRQEKLRKAISNGTVKVLDRNLLSSMESTSESLLNQIDLEGERLRLYIDRGEAFSHAASMCLRVPIVSNDSRAVRLLAKQGESFVKPVIRFWDLISLGYQHQILKDIECDRVRQQLIKISESVHPCFRNRSFEGGLPEYYPRFVDGDCPSVGAARPMEEFDSCITIFHTTERISRVSVARE